MNSIKKTGDLENIDDIFNELDSQDLQALVYASIISPILRELHFRKEIVVPVYDLDNFYNETGGLNLLETKRITSIEELDPNFDRELYLRGFKLLEKKRLEEKKKREAD